MDVVVLMGGLGSRLGNLAIGHPKSMVEVNGKPFFEYVLRLLQSNGFTNFIFLTGYMGDQIEGYFGDGSQFGANITYSSDGERLLGTAGALRNALAHLSEEFILLYGDSYVDIDYHELICQFRFLREKAAIQALMAVYRNRNRWDRSNVVFHNGHLILYDKENTTQDMDHIDSGVSILTRAVVSELPSDIGLDLADVYRTLVQEGRMQGHEVRQRFYEVGTPDGLVEFRDFITDRARPRPAIFLDRDGTLNEMVYHETTEQLDTPFTPAVFRFIPGVVEALADLQSLGYTLIVVTNQPGAAKGKVRLCELYRLNSFMDEMLRKEGIILDEIVMCPHHPSGDPDRCLDQELIRECECRKPRSLMLSRCIGKFNIDRSRSYMVGDSYVDVLAGKHEQLTCVFIGNYKCDTCQLLGEHKPDLVFSTLKEFSGYLKGQAHENSDGYAYKNFH